MSKAHIAEVKVTYTTAEAFDAGAVNALREFLEENGCNIYVTANENDGACQQWELDKGEVQTIIDGIKDDTIALDKDCLEEVGTYGEVLDFLINLVNSNGNSSVCHIHWF